jgi:hypothetical protein
MSRWRESSLLSDVRGNKHNNEREIQLMIHSYDRISDSYRALSLTQVQNQINK